MDERLGVPTSKPAAPRRSRPLVLVGNLAQQVGLAVWLGGILTIGAVVAPAAFRTLLSREEAGLLVGNVLRSFNWVSLVAAALLLFGQAAEWFYGPRGGWGRLWEVARFLAVALCLGVTLYFMISLMPHMMTVRAQGRAAEFDSLHQAYTRLAQFQVLLLLGVALSTAVLSLGVGGQRWKPSETGPASR